MYSKQEPVGHHALGHVPGPRDVVRQGHGAIEVRPAGGGQLLEGFGRQQELARHLVAEPLDGVLGHASKRAADPASADPDVGKLVQEREGPRRGSVFVVDDDEGRYVVGEREAAEHLLVDVGVVGAEVAQEQHEDPSPLRRGAQEVEQVRRVLRPPLVRGADAEPGADSVRHRLCAGRSMGW
jgi:hypothetical protein